MRRAALGCLLAAALSLPAGAQSLKGALEWLPAGSLSVESLTQHPEERLEGGTQQSFYVEFGRLAFRSPDILGGTARKAGLSCQACHANGFATRAFFIPGLSDRPGRIDVSHAFWNLRGEDGVDNPVEIPSLRGVKTKERFGQDRRVASLREFTRRVIVTEFAGDEPDALLLDALVAYQEKLQPAPAAERRITLAGDLDDLARAAALVMLPLREENPPLTDRIAAMVRGQIGFIHERFDGQPDAQGLLEGWSRRLAAIDRQAQAGQWPAARRALADWAAEVSPPPQVLMDAAPRSLYDEARLKAWLSKPAR